MATPTSLTDTDHMRQFETRIISMPPEVKERFIDDYLDWLYELAWSLGTAPEKEKNETLKDVVDVFILGKRKPDKELLEKIQEATTILFYIIGDVSADAPIVRLDRAQRRRVKLLNLWRAFMGLEALPAPTIPGFEPGAVEIPELEEEATEILEGTEAEAEVED